jgi:hypothetical protein
MEDIYELGVDLGPWHLLNIDLSVNIKDMYIFLPSVLFQMAYQLSFRLGCHINQ